MATTTITATYSGSWEAITGNWSQVMSTGSKGGYNGGIECKLRHPQENNDYWDEIKTGFVQFNTSSLADNCTITSAKLKVLLTVNARTIGGFGAAISTMAWGNRYDEGVDEFTTGNVLGAPEEGYSSGIRNFPINTPDTNISKTGYTKFNLGQTNFIDRNSPGISAPYGDSNRDDFACSGVDNGTETNRPQLVIVWTTPPVVTTGSATNIEGTTATLAGNVTDVGGGTVSSRGVCWSTSANPTTSDSKETSAGSTGAYTVSATSLTKNTTYNCRAYVITENSTQYGANVVFVTDVEPTVVSTSVDRITSITARGNGNVTSDGSGTVTERGFCWNTTGTPTTASNKVTSNSGTGVYSATMTGLLPSIKYYARAYAINGVGTSYGAELTFIPPSGAGVFFSTVI